MPLVLPGQEVRLNEPGRTFERHHHLSAYAALLVSGTCHEVGDRGRFELRPGDVLLHRPFDGHSDRVGNSGAAFINVPLAKSSEWSLGRVRDLDAVVRAFERGLEAGREEFSANFVPEPIGAIDWPDQLAADLARGSHLRLDDWADRHQLNPASVSRGFRLAYGLTPKRFRLEQMVAEAARRVTGWLDPLSLISVDCGFSDQAHMTRTFTRMFGVAPGALRRRAS